MTFGGQAEGISSALYLHDVRLLSFGVPRFEDVLVGQAIFFICQLGKL